jgi:hypothetical protein
MKGESFCGTREMTPENTSRIWDQEAGAATEPECGLFEKSMFMSTTIRAKLRTKRGVLELGLLMVPDEHVQGLVLKCILPREWVLGSNLICTLSTGEDDPVSFSILQVI